MKSQIPLVSIIVPIYNAVEYIDFTVKSILSQTHQNLEIILVNDGSTDNSKNLCKKWAAIESKVIFLDKENGGTASARNLGLLHAKGEYIQFLDSDDYLSPSKLNDQIQFMINNNLDVSYTDSAVFVDDVNTYQITSWKLSKWYISFKSALYMRWGIDFTIPIHSFLYKKDFLERNNLLSFNNKIRYREDWNFHINVSKANPSIKKINKLLTFYRANPNGKTSSWKSILKGNMLFFNSRTNSEIWKFIPRISLELWMIILRSIKYRDFKIIDLFLGMSFPFYISLFLAVLILPLSFLYVLYRSIVTNPVRNNKK